MLLSHFVCEQLAMLLYSLELYECAEAFARWGVNVSQILHCRTRDELKELGPDINTTTFERVRSAIEACTPSSGLPKLS